MYKKDTDTGLLLMRIGMGLLFVWGGLEKFFEGFMGGVGLNMVSGMLGSIGFGFLGEGGTFVLAVVLALAELVSAVLLLLGVYTRAASLVLAVIMFVAFAFVHIPSGNWMNSMIHLALWMSLLGMSFAGSGKKASKED